MNFSLAQLGVIGEITRRRRLIVLLLLQRLQKPRRVISLSVPSDTRQSLFENFIASMSARRFKRTFRMSLGTFTDLCAAIVRTRMQAERPLRYRIPVQVRLSMTLRYLAGGSYIDISLAYLVSVSTFYFVVHETLADIDEVLRPKFPYEDPDRLHEISASVTRGKSPLSGCVGALDGIAIRITESTSREVANPVTCYNRKGMFSLCIQAVCDFKYRFMFASALCPCYTRDSVAFAASSFSTFLYRSPNDGLPQGFFIAADEAYSCSDRVLTPWPGRGLPCEKDCFNFWLSSARIHIKQSFGMLVGRWGIFWRPSECSVVRASQIILVCMKLHNFTLDRGSIAVPEPSNIDLTGHEAYSPVVFQVEGDADPSLHSRRRDVESSMLRQTFTQEIKNAGLRRP
jgi:DDE superfamily endonuclease